MDFTPGMYESFFLLTRIYTEKNYILLRQIVHVLDREWFLRVTRMEWNKKANKW